MKWIILILTMLVSEVTLSQTLKDIFLGIPDHFSMTRIQRDSLINNFLKKETDGKGVGIQKHYLTRYDPRNGFLAFTGAYEGSTSMTFWNVSNGSKLIGIVSQSCGGACDNHIDFIKHSDGKYQQMPMGDILPKLSFSDFMDVRRMEADRIDLERVKSIFNNYELLYHLPSKGKNITVESQYHELDMDDKMKVYSLGSKIQLIWQDGKFIKGGNMD